MTATNIMELQNAPGPKGHFFLGSLPEPRKDPLGLFTRALRDYGDVARMKFGGFVVHLVNSPDGIKHVLQDNAKNYVKGFGYDQLHPLLGQGLLTSEGSFWHRQRKLAQPAFHRHRIAGFASTITKVTEEMLDLWRPCLGTGRSFDVAAEMTRLTMRVAGLTLLSKDVKDEADVVGRCMALLIPEANRRILSIVHIWEKVPFRRNRLYSQALREMDNLIMGIIDERRKNGHPQDDDLLSMLMEARDEETGEMMSDKQLRDEVMTIFLAGHETTANCLAWTWALLSKHPEVERKLRGELESVLGGRAPTFDDIPRLRYANMIIQESMRLYPPAWVISRQALADDEIKGFKIPIGSIVVISQYTAHRNPAYWDNPEGFDPERFAEDRAERPKYTYFPFSGGPRQCIGNNFAMMEAILVLATVAQRYRLDLVPGFKIEPEPLITLRPKHGIHVTLRV